MRIQIHIDDKLAEHLEELAWTENRYPKQQAEWLLRQAIQEAVQDKKAREELSYVREG